MRKENWVWMPHAAHFIGADRCRYRLATYVGGYIVSTIGDYFPMGASQLEKIGFDRMYETYVFKAGEVALECGCKYKPTSWQEIDSRGSNCPNEAYENHIIMCNKWAKKKAAL